VRSTRTVERGRFVGASAATTERRAPAEALDVTQKVDARDRGGVLAGDHRMPFSLRGPSRSGSRLEMWSLDARSVVEREGMVCGLR
jgi:hypothetical protein